MTLSRSFTILLLLCAFLHPSLSHRRLPKQSLAEADHAFAEKSYAAALKEYQMAAQAGTVPANRRDEVAFRIAVSLGKTEGWDGALATSLDFVKTRRSTVWEPRGLYWLGRLYLALPYRAFRVGSKITYSSNVPDSDSNVAPQLVNVGALNALNARDAMEAARIRFPGFRKQWSTEAEEAQLNFDLARLLQNTPDYRWTYKQRWPSPTSPYWNVDPTVPYQTQWEYPRKLLYLYTQIGQIAPSKRIAALSLFGEASWLHLYHQQVQSFARKWQNKKWVDIPYPYQHLREDDVMRSLIARYPQDPIRDEAQFTLALWQEQENRFTDALQEYRDLRTARPHGRWRNNALAHIRDITQPDLSLSTTPQSLDTPAHFTLSYRNALRVVCRAYRAYPETVLHDPKQGTNPKDEWDKVESIFGPLKAMHGHPVAQWTVTLRNRGDHRPRSKEVTLPFRTPGAYVIEALTPGAHAVNGLFLSDMVIVQKTHWDGCLLYVVNQRTGKPIPYAHVLAKLWWSKNEKERSTLVAGTTASDGTLNIPFPSGRDISPSYIAALAHSAGHYAMTNRTFTMEYSNGSGKFRAYSITDRAVYRPSQAVQFHETVVRKLSGAWMPVAHHRMTVEAIDPKRNTVYKQTTTSDEFGCVNGQFTLAADAPLGEYALNIAVNDETAEAENNGGNRFRVEEYKKPEFAVTVLPEVGHVRLGKVTNARVRATYYFGGPVANAKVTYRVYRTLYSSYYTFPSRYDFLYSYNGSGEYDTYYRRGVVVAQGTAHTDARGEARVTFMAGADEAILARAKQMALRGGEVGWAYYHYYQAQDYQLTVEADVQDASRRVISGVGDLKATHCDVAAFLNYAHGYATQGDRVEIEVHTQDMAGRPVAVAGFAQVYRATETPGGKDTLLSHSTLHTDAHGRAYIHWTAKNAGYFHVVFVTHDSTGQSVSAQIPLWVNGPELAHGRFLFRDVSLIARDHYGTEGQTARVLLVTEKPGSTVLLTREADNEILDRRVITIPGRSLELNIPLTQRDVPNLYLNAVLVRDNQLYRAESEMFVPPVKQFATVTVLADRAHYQPGETATLRIHASDWQGRPLRTEQCLSVSDAALTYIQKDYAADIRIHFYGNQRSASNYPDTSMNRTFQGVDDRFPPLPAWISETPMLPNGMGQLQDWPGEQGGFYREFGMLYRPSVLLYRDDPTLEMPFTAGDEAYRIASTPQVYLNDSRGRVTMRRTREQSMAMMGGGGMGGAGSPDAFAADEAGRSAKMAGLSGEVAEASVRSHFADTAFWTPAIITDTHGEATVKVTWPDNLTQWRVAAVGSTATAQVGSGEVRVAVKKDLLVRLETPRFLVERDRVMLSANIHNYLSQPEHVRVTLDIGSDAVQLVPSGSPELGKALSPASTWLDLAPNSEKRVDWMVAVRREGALRVRVTAQGQTAGDAMEMTIPVLVHGVERTTAQSGLLREQSRASIPIVLPIQHMAGSSELVVHLEPSLGGILLDALPYLADYPYGCTEQTVSRFLPGVLVAKALRASGVNLEILRKRASLLKKQAARSGNRGVTDSPYTYPQGIPGVLQVQDLTHSLERADNPVFDKARLDRMVADGLARLARFQGSDGGWGWWPQDGSDPYMTCYALDGLELAQTAGYTVKPEMLQHGLDYLLKEFLNSGDGDLPLMAYEARVLARTAALRARILPTVNTRLFAYRERLSPYVKALLALALHDLGDAPKADVVLRNVETTVQTDTENGTAHWDNPDGSWWHWYGDKVETNATLLQAYLAIAPRSPLMPMLAKWLVNNRQGAIWNSTRETALAVDALCAYSQFAGEFRPNYTLTVDLGGRVHREYTVTQENALLFDNTFVVPDALLRTGEQALTLTRNGEGVCYYSAYTRYFSEEEPIPATGNEIFVTRRYFHLLPNTAYGEVKETALNLDRPNPFLAGRYDLLTTGIAGLESGNSEEGPQYQREPLHSGDTLTSGDLVEVELQLESKNDYEYLVFEDIKPAGCEPVELRSGEHEGLGVYSNMELRDQKVAFFLASLPQGKRVLSYRLRAETPGAFHVLPTSGYAMYAPGLRTLSDEMRLNIHDDN